MAGSRDEGCHHVRCEAALTRSTRYRAVMLTPRTEANAAIDESCVITVVIRYIIYSYIILILYYYDAWLEDLNFIVLPPESLV